MISRLFDVIVLLDSKEHIVKRQVNVILARVKILDNAQFFRTATNAVVREDFAEQDARFETNATQALAETVEVVPQLDMIMLVVASLVLLERTVKWSRNASLSTLASMVECAMKTSRVINVLVLLVGLG